MNLPANIKTVDEEVDYFPGRSLIFTIRRHSAGQTVDEAAKVAQESTDKARRTRLR